MTGSAVVAKDLVEEVMVLESKGLVEEVKELVAEVTG